MFVYIRMMEERGVGRVQIYTHTHTHTISHSTITGTSAVIAFI